MTLETELGRLRQSLNNRAAMGEMLEAKREMEHFVSFTTLREASAACAHFERAGFSTDSSAGQDDEGRFPIRVYREQSMDAHSAEQSLRTVYDINRKHNGVYEDFGAVVIMPEGSRPAGFFSRLLGRETEDGENSWIQRSP